MKKLTAVVFLVFFGFISLNAAAISNPDADAQTSSTGKKVDLYFFWSHNCPHCVAAHPFINKLAAQYPWLKVHSLEASANAKNAHLFEKMARQHGREPGYFPTFFIGDKMIVGYTGTNSTGAEIRQAVNEYHNK